MIRDVSAALTPHRDWLLRWFVRHGADPAAADDLVQLTLIEAWRNLAKLQDVSGLRPWLQAIAWHVLRRWRRDESNRQHRFVPAIEREDLITDIPDTNFPEPSAASEHDELAGFLDDALQHLPRASRDLLTARYRDELTVADLARCLGITPAHAGVRLQRAREQARRILIDACGSDLESFGVVPGANTWRSTRLWCPSCGSSRLDMELDPANGAFALKCPDCTAPPGHFLYNWRLVGTGHVDNPLRSARTSSQALRQTIEASTWKVPPVGQVRQCPRCHNPVTVHPGLPPGAPDDLVHLQLDMWCPDCGPLSASATFGGMAAFHPGGLAFWQEHGRISTRPPQRTTFEQTDAILVDLVSNSTSSTLTYIFSPNGEQVLAIIPDA